MKKETIIISVVIFLVIGVIAYWFLTKPTPATTTQTITNTSGGSGLLTGISSFFGGGAISNAINNQQSTPVGR